MLFFVLTPNAVEHDGATTFIRTPGLPPKTENVGIQLDYWPVDDLFEAAMDLFCSERLKACLKKKQPDRY